MAFYKASLQNLSLFNFKISLLTLLLLVLSPTKNNVNALLSSPKQPLHPNNVVSRTTFTKTIIPSIFLITNTKTNPSHAYDPDPDKLRESLYLMSRVQEATVQQERLVNRNLKQEELKQKMKLSLRLVDRSYKLLDQINFTSQYVMPQSEIVDATEAGLLAVESLQSAIDYVNTDLNVGELKKEQKEFLISALRSTRDEIFTYVKYMPQDKLEQARLRIERENVDNREEFDGPSDAGVYNPVKLPWK